MLAKLKQALNSNDNNPIANQSYLITVGEKTLGEASEIVKNLLTERSVFNKDEIKEIKTIERESMLGCKKSSVALVDKLKMLLKRFGIKVANMTTEEVAKYIYQHAWGLGPIDDLYNQPDVDEVQIIGIDTVFSIRRGNPTKENIKFSSKEELDALVTRLLINSKDLSTIKPYIRTVRKDKTRVFITGEPLTKIQTITLRKKDTFKYTKQNLIDFGTMDGKTYELLKLFSRGLINMLISGPAGSGKTSQLVHFFGFRNPNYRTVVMEPDLEMMLQDMYPGWNIIELEEQLQLGIDMLTMFNNINLQLSPVSTIIGEILGGHEVREAVKSGVRGQKGNISTFHSKCILDALLNLALIYIEETDSKSMSIEIARKRVVQAFDVFVQLDTQQKTGKKKIVHIAVPYLENETFKLHDIVKWISTSEEDYFKGYWQHFPLPGKIIDDLYVNGMPKSEIIKFEKERLDKIS